MEMLHYLKTQDIVEIISTPVGGYGCFTFGREGWTSIEDNASSFETFAYYATVETGRFYTPSLLEFWQREIDKRIPENIRCTDRWVKFGQELIDEYFQGLS